MAVLTRLSVRDFRNIERGEIEVPEEGIALIGENGQGKTNLLEAIYYFHLLRSVRGGRDQDLVRFEAPAFHIAAGVVTDGRHDVSAAFARVGGRKKVVVDGGEVGRLSDGLGALPSVMLSPRDADIVSGGPSERRRFLDVVLALTSRRYLGALQTYRSALARRNAALREVGRTGRGEDGVAVWEPALAENGAVLLAERWAWVLRYAEDFATLCRVIGERAAVAMCYETKIERPADAYGALLSELERKRGSDIKRGITHVGPHRDDLGIALGGRDLRLFGSAGQRRTAAIALRMLEARTLRERNGSEPVLLLDDPFAELDVRRGEHILALLHEGGVGQTILAVPRPTDVPREFTRLQRWCIYEGVLSREGA